MQTLKDFENWLTNVDLRKKAGRHARRVVEIFDRIPDDVAPDALGELDRRRSDVLTNRDDDELAKAYSDLSCSVLHGSRARSNTRVVAVGLGSSDPAVREAALDALGHLPQNGAP